MELSKVGHGTEFSDHHARLTRDLRHKESLWRHFLLHSFTRAKRKFPNFVMEEK